VLFEDSRLIRMQSCDDVFVDQRAAFFRAVNEVDQVFDQ